MKQSLWGQKSSVNSLITNLQSEVDEFISACKQNNANNVWEEASDILMLLACILQKNYNSANLGPDELPDRVIEKLHWRYSDIYSDIVFDSEENENKQWENAKAIEHMLETMFCSNPACSDSFKLGSDNIIHDKNTYTCKSCKSAICPSSKNTVFFRYKDAARILSNVCKAVLDYSKGKHNVSNALKTDDPRSFRALSSQLSKSIDTKKDTSYAKILAEYIYRKSNISEHISLRFFEEIEQLYNNIDHDNILLEKYYEYIEQEQYDAKNHFTISDWSNIKKALGELSFEVVQKIEKTLLFSARSWNNEVAHKYLLAYPDRNSDTLIECMTILHYDDASVKDITIEVSNMYNCVVGCRFCASGALPGNVKMLDSMDYVRQINTCIKESGIDPRDFENFYVSFAGIGEPSVTYKSITGGMAIIRDLYPNVKFNIATFGYQKECFSYWQECNMPIRTIQIPLYHIIDEKLKDIVLKLPQNYQLSKVIEQAIQYKEKHPNCRIKINYIPFLGKNDSDKDIYSFMDFLLPYKEQIIIKVSFLNYTKTADENGFICPGAERLSSILQLFQQNGFVSYVFGTETNTALGCGQLAQMNISGTII